MTASTAARPQAPVGRSEGDFVGTMLLLRLAIRRDRIRMPATILGFAVLAGYSYSAAALLYPDLGPRRDAAEAINSSPALVALFGRIYDTASLGSVATIKYVSFMAALLSVLMVLHMARHTRGEEDSGRAEFLLAGAVGRLAPLSAAMLASTVLALGVAGASGVALVVAGAEPSGSVAFALAWFGVAEVFALSTAVVAQLVRENRPTIGIGVGLIAGAYVLRAVGDLAGGSAAAATWVSPFGWGQQIRPFAGNHLWIGVIPLVASAGLALGALALRRRRDLGAGLLPTREGPARGRTGSSVGLVWRLNRGILTAWAVGVVVMGYVVGTLVNSADTMFEGAAARRFIEALGGKQGLTDAFLAAELGIVALLISSVGIIVINFLGREEEAGRTALALSGPTSRIRWAGAGFVVACGAVTALTVLAGASVGAGAAQATGDGGWVLRLSAAGFAYVPASLVIVGLATLAYGLRPRLVPGVWGLLLGFVLVATFGDLWGLPQWLVDLSPFTHSPRLPGEPVEPGVLIALSGLAALLSAAGLFRWTRRDLTG